jgi:hypothetical protein
LQTNLNYFYCLVNCIGEEGYTLHVHTADDIDGYTLHPSTHGYTLQVHTAGGKEGYTGFYCYTLYVIVHTAGDLDGYTLHCTPPHRDTPYTSTLLAVRRDDIPMHDHTAGDVHVDGHTY